MLKCIFCAGMDCTLLFCLSLSFFCCNTSISPSLPPFSLSLFLPSTSIQGMEYLHSRGISHGRLTTAAIHIHNRVCIQFRPQVKLPRHISCEELVSLPPEDVRALYLINGNLVLPNSPSLKPDVFAFGWVYNSHLPFVIYINIIYIKKLLYSLKGN